LIVELDDGAGLLGSISSASIDISTLRDGSNSSTWQVYDSAAASTATVSLSLNLQRPVKFDRSAFQLARAWQGSVQAMYKVSGAWVDAAPLQLGGPERIEISSHIQQCRSEQSGSTSRAERGTAAPCRSLGCGSGSGPYAAADWWVA